MKRDGRPRKVVVGTSMHNMFGAYPGLDARIGELSDLVDRMADEAGEVHGRGLDIAAFPEYSVTGGKTGPASEISLPLEGELLESIGAKAREHACYIVLPLMLAEDREAGTYSNAAVLIGRDGDAVGIYRKVHPVPGPGLEELEGGIIAGREFPVFDCDFGRVAIQICYDMAFDDGWETLSRKGAELVVWPSQWPGRINPSARAVRYGYHILSSTWRNNASLIDPTGHIIRDIHADGVFTELIDLECVLINWHSALLEGKAFTDRFGEKAGYRYDPAEDCGIFWSNDENVPIMQMVKELGLTPRPEELARDALAQDEVRGGPPEVE